MSGLLDQEIVHQCRIVLSLLVMMGRYSQDSRISPCCNSTFIRHSNINGPLPELPQTGRNAFFGSASQQFQDVNSLVALRWNQQRNSTLVLVLLLLGRLARDAGGQESSTTNRSAHSGFGRGPTSLCKAVMMRIGILPHTYNFQGIYPFSHPATVVEALVFSAQV